jgi:hypothetical protein
MFARDLLNSSSLIANDFWRLGGGLQKAEVADRDIPDRPIPASF